MRIRPIRILYALSISLPLSIAATHVFLGLLLVALGYDGIRKRTLTHTFLNRPILFYLSIAIASAVVSLNPARSLLHLVVLWHIPLYLIVAREVTSPVMAQRLIGLLFGVASLNAFYGIVQHVSGGMDLFQFDHYERILRVGDQVRATGVFDHFMTFSGQMLLLGLLGTGLLLFSNSAKIRWILIGAVALFFGAIWASLTRSAWIGLVAGLLVMGGFKGRRMFFALGVGLLLTVAILYFVDRGFQTRVVSTTRMEDYSNIERIRTWEATLAMIRDHPLVGVGIGNYRKVLDQYRERYGSGSHSHAHNTLLQVTAENGLIGLAAYLSIWYFFFREMIRKANGTSDPFILGLTVGTIGALAGFHVAGLFEYNLGDSEVAALMWLIVGLAVAAQSGRIEKSSPSQDRHVH
jgi:O-Antigen ligase